MKAAMLSKLAILSVAAVFSFFSNDAQAQQSTTSPKRTIVVSLEDRKLALIEDGQLRKVYTVAVGKPSTPSPEGTFNIERRVANPTYHHDGKTVLAGPGNPVGTRWMGLNKSGYGIHGTNEPRSIGKAASHGCIRMAKADLEEFYELVEVGDTVELVGHRNEETARLFGADKPIAPGAEPLLTVRTEPAVPATEQPAAAAINNAASPAVAANSASGVPSVGSR